MFQLVQYTKGLKMILAGDIGGTNTRLAITDEKMELKIVCEKKYKNSDFSSFEDIALSFLKENKQEVLRACFCIAGPIRKGKSQTTNLPWIFDTEELSQKLQIKEVHLINDLVANAYGIQVLKPTEFFELQKGVQQEGNRALVSAGTGLGEAGLFWDGKTHIPFPSEGGHTDFAPRNELEIDLFYYMKSKYNHVSNERVISGPGIALLYQFLTEEKHKQKSKEIEEAMKIKNPTAVIAEFAIEKQDEVCLEAIHWFLSLYGSEAGNTALKFLSVGGVYLGGGIAPKLCELIRSSLFVESFSKKGRFESLLKSIPVFIVMNDQAALLGAANYASLMKPK